MGNSYTQIHLHLVCAVKYRQALIADSWKDELYKYITGIVQKNTHKLLIINGMPDHVHIFTGLRPHQSLSELMQNIKGSSSEWINKKHLTNHAFHWQEGYAGFSYGHSQIPAVIRYIKNQQEHHKKQSFIDEYRTLLKLFDVKFEERYLMKEPE